MSLYGITSRRKRGFKSIRGSSRMWPLPESDFAFPKTFLRPQIWLWCLPWRDTVLAVFVATLGVHTWCTVTSFFPWCVIGYCYTPHGGIMCTPQNKKGWTYLEPVHIFNLLTVLCIARHIKLHFWQTCQQRFAKKVLKERGNLLEGAY